MSSTTPETNLFRHAERFETFDAGASIFDTGEPGDLMYAVKHGEVDLVVEGETVETVGPGGVFGEMALIEHDVRSATAVARTACELVPIDERRFTFLVQQNPYFAMHVFRVLAGRLRRMNRT
jgi:CRP/FNR family transcriptional regulator, cyclic AMP receptor protein